MFRSPPQASVKRILFFTSFFSEREWQSFGLSPERLKEAGCEFTNCLGTPIWDPNAWPAETYDAVLFHGRDMDSNVQGPSNRSLHQRYIFFLLESPMNDNLDYSRFAGFFNWTMTYRRDSDIVAAYGEFRDSTTNVEPILERVKALSKPKMVVGVVSNCQTSSKREEYVRELHHFVPVDIFGRCGDMQMCPGRRADNCKSLIEEEYMFYLAFENSKCTDYVTEKFFLALSMDIVPIVMGGANYSAIAPQGSYIDVNDFSSAEKLAEELKRLSNNREEYLNFFRWKAKTKVIPEQWGCNLCKSLQDPKPSKTYEDLGAWWIGGGNCQ